MSCRMERISCFAALVLVGFLLAVPSQVSAQPLGSSFNYQGLLEWQGAPANGPFDIRFRLFDSDSGGTILGTVALLSTPVSSGLFEADLDFGPRAFDGSERWVEIAVRSVGSPSYTVLAPRRRIAPAPYALHALNGSQGGDAFWEASGSNIFYLGGRVGIGTSSPTQKLTVAGSIESTSGGFRFPDGSTQTTAAAPDNLGNHVATTNISFQNVGEGLISAGGARLRTGASSGGTWFVTPGSSESHRFGVDLHESPPGGQSAEFVIDKTGKVGIFDFFPDFAVDVINDSTWKGTIRANRFLTYQLRGAESAPRIADALEIVNSLQGLESRVTVDGATKRVFGFRAEEVGDILPGIVERDSDEDSPGSIDTMSLIPILVEAVKQLNQRVQDEAAEIARLRSVCSGESELEAGS